MSRQTAFPGVIIQSIEAKSGESGRMLEFEEGMPENIPPERIKSFLETLTLFRSDLVDSKMVYNLLVGSYTPMSAAVKARSIVRLKNPFEPDVIDVSTPEKQDDLGLLKGGRNVYKISVTVEK